MSIIERDLRFYLRMIRTAAPLQGLLRAEAKASGYLDGLHAGGAISGELYTRLHGILLRAAQRRDNQLTTRKKP